MGTIYKASLPFILSDVMVMTLIFVFPAIALVLVVAS
jgi:TRAP-type mannitol/chloroaromatic compound transport system permease large subunit